MAHEKLKTGKKDDVERCVFYASTSQCDPAT